jgi:hypothetical protein
MRALQAFGGDPYPVFESISDAKRDPRRARLVSLRSRIRTLYATYVSDITILATLRPASFSGNEAGDLIHCYTSETRPLSELKNVIEEGIRESDPVAYGICQYCGLTHAPETWDHYLPKEQFPEFATHALNLVPACHQCNNLKGEKWTASCGRRRILSLYYDKLPIGCYINVRLTLAPKPKAEFGLSDKSSDFGNLEPEIRSHYRELDLLRRFGKAASAEIEDKRTELRDTLRLPGGVVDAKRLLEKAVSNLSKTHSANYWKVPLFRAMADSNDFLDWCRL